MEHSFLRRSVVTSDVCNF